METKNERFINETTRNLGYSFCGSPAPQTGMLGRGIDEERRIAHEQAMAESRQKSDNFRAELTKCGLIARVSPAEENSRYPVLVWRKGGWAHYTHEQNGE